MMKNSERRENTLPNTYFIVERISIDTWFSAYMYSLIFNTDTAVYYLNLNMVVTFVSVLR